MVNLFKFVGNNNPNNKEFQFWKQDYHPIELSTNQLLEQKLLYLHENPVRAGLVWEAWHYKYSKRIIGNNLYIVLTPVKNRLFMLSTSLRLALEGLI